MRRSIAFYVLLLYSYVATCQSSQSDPPSAGGSATGTTGTIEGSSEKLVGTDANTFPVGGSAYAHIFDQSTFARVPTASGYGSQLGSYRAITTYGPGLDLGNAGGWRTQTNTYLTGLFAARGITQGLGISLQKHAVGDVNNYFYSYSDEGRTDQSGEGHELLAMDGGENDGYFHGTIASTMGVGDTAPVLAFVSGNNWTTDGAFLLDLSKGAIHGNYNGGSRKLNGTYLEYLPVTNSLPLTTAWGQLTAAIENPGIPPNTSASLTATIQLRRIGSETPSFTTGHACIAGPNYPEQTTITMAGQAVRGRQTIILKYKNPNGTVGSSVTYPILFQGGICGQYISEDANMAYSGYRTSYYAFASLTGSDLIYGVNLAGSLLSQELPMVSEAQTKTSGYHLYPGAEIVTNTTTGATPILEANVVDWMTGDLVEAPHYPMVNTSALHLDLTQNTPSNNQHSYESYAVVHGFGVASQSFYADYLLNANPSSYYSDFGGPVATPYCGHCVDGYWTSPFYTVYGPASGGAVLSIGGTERGDARPYALFQQKYGTGSGDIMTYDPATSTVDLPGGLTVAGHTICRSDGKNCPAVSAVTNSGVTNLIFGAVVVATTAACDPALGCIYKLTNCGAADSTAIGVPTVGRVRRGVSFEIKSLSSTSTPVRGDASTVFWQIN